MVRVSASQKDLSDLQADVVACFAHEGDRRPRGVENRDLLRELAAEMKAERFRGKRGDVLRWNADGRFASRRFMVIGLGPATGAPEAALREASARAARAAEKFSAKTLALRLPASDRDGAGPAARAAAEGAILGSYRFERYVTDAGRKRSQLRRVEVAAAGTPATLRQAVARGSVTARAVYLARDLVNEPPSRMNPTELGRRARAEARRAGLACRVLGPADLAKLGMEGVLAVSRGSSQPARVVHLTYKPRGRRTGKVVLVGKGVTFDSGGLNLKPGNSMLTMKGDMAGAAAVLATLTALGDVGCRLEVHGLLGLVENMTGAEAFKPGDILKTYSGKTVEVGNTDAEGRLVLGDLLAYAASKLKPERMIDLATLTGACVVALGPLCGGLFSRHDDLRREILDAGERAGEKLWPLPLIEEYLESMQDGPADLKNVGDRWGGAITAALFLGEFVPRELPWAHMDIAGPAFFEKDAPEAPVGGTGAGVRTLLRWFEER